MAGDNRIILVPRMIVPLPETKDFMVEVEKKEAAEAKLSVSQKIYQDRNQQILTYFKTLVPSKSPRTFSSWRFMQIPSGHPRIHFEWLYRGRKQEDRTLDVAVHFETGSKDQNQKLCEFLEEKQTTLEESLGEVPVFAPNWTLRWSSVYVERSCEPWSEDIVHWAADKMHKLIQVAQPLIEEFYSKQDKD